ncbi:hypothetical protein T484DRAFT_1758201, partial [Baffinella frigidus]
MTSGIPEDDKVKSMIAQLAELPHASKDNSAMLVFSTLNDEEGFVDNYMTRVLLDTETDTTMRGKLNKFSSILAKEHTDDTIEITKNDRVELKGIKTFLGNDMGERLDRVVSERSKMTGQLYLDFQNSQSEFFSEIQSGDNTESSKEHIRVKYQVPWEELGQKLKYAEENETDNEGVLLDEKYKAGVRQMQKNIEFGLFEYVVMGRLPKILLTPVEPISFWEKTKNRFVRPTPVDPSDTGHGPGSSAPAIPSSSPAESSPIHADTTTEGHRTTGYTPDTAETEDIDETFYTTYIDWMSTLKHNMTRIIDSHESTHIRENLGAIKSTDIFHPDTSPPGIEEYWTYSQNGWEEKQWTKWCETEEELDAENQNEYDTKFSNVSSEVAELREELQALESDDDKYDAIKKDLDDKLTIACSEQRELDATSIEKKRVVVVQAIVDSIEKISSSCVALQIAERMLTSIVTTENDHMTEDLKTLVGIDVEYGQYDNDHVTVATICKPPPATKPTKPTNPQTIYTGDSWDSILSATRYYGE